MRGGARAAFAVTPRDFAWDRAVAATLRHSTLPWNETLAATPLTAATFGSRDRLSLLAQFAAHQAALRFAGIPDGDVDPSQYAVVQQRGSDVRLVRRSAGGCGPDAALPLLTLATQFAAAVRAPELDVFRHSWARAEAVYLECYFRLRADAAADLRWVRRSATAAILEPGPQGLRLLPPGRHAYASGDCIQALEVFGREVHVLRGGSVLRYDALEPLRAVLGDFTEAAEAAVAERITETCAAGVLVVDRADAFDPASRRVLQMLASSDVLTILTRDTASPTLEETRRFIVAPTIAAAERAAAASEKLVEGDGLDEFLRRGTLPPSGIGLVGEPARSYLAVIALLGGTASVDAAAGVLRALNAEIALGDLALAGVSELAGGSFRVLQAGEMAMQIPAASRAALCRLVAGIAAEHGLTRRAAELLAQAGDFAAANEMFLRVQWTDGGETIESLYPLPVALLDAGLRLRLANALTDAGRYRDAAAVAETRPDETRDLALARVERRTGDYAVASARLERLPRSAEADVVLAEIMIVLRRDDEAKELLASSAATTDRAGFLRCLVSPGSVRLTNPYFAARAAGYAALERGDPDEALRSAGEAIRSAPSLADRIDARLDLVFALFQAGRWTEAREAALMALSEVEETHGDRAAGGLLFLLAYLYADEGRWTLASQRITRLRHFYGATRDGRHLDELDLLAAHLDFSRGRFIAARREAEAILGRSNDRPITEAAALVVDEIDWVHGRPVAERPEPVNVEFARRHAMVRGGPAPLRPLAPQAFRLALAAGDHAGAEAIAARSGIELEIAARPGEVEIHVLRALVSAADFPPPSHALEVRWRYAARNRLGAWNQWGSLPRAADEVLDAMLAVPEQDWVRCSDRELVEIEGIAAWPGEGREAVASAFALRGELSRLLKVHQQHALASSPSVAMPAGVIGSSAAIRDAIGRLTRVARREVAVCILGESGTGKELAARALHAASNRRQKPFVVVNCAALPENLIESELFGHVRGAFTGADRDRVGLVEAADGGTLFLDEIGEMPLIAQAKLLRLLQEGEFRRVGEATSRSTDVRVVVATNRALDAAVEQGTFREDLYYRVRGIEVAMPPLRDRGDDILLLADHFLERERTRHRGGPARLSDEARDLFLAYPWPGNVRELQNTVRAAHAMAGDGLEIALEHLPERMRRQAEVRPTSGSYQDAVANFRRELIENALADAEGNQNRAASKLRISRQALGYQIRELGILTRKRRQKPV